MCLLSPLYTFYTIYYYHEVAFSINRPTDQPTEWNVCTNDDNAAACCLLLLLLMTTLMMMMMIVLLKRTQCAAQFRIFTYSHKCHTYVTCQLFLARIQNVLISIWFQLNFLNVDNGRAFLSAKFQVLSNTPNIQTMCTQITTSNCIDG